MEVILASDGVRTQGRRPPTDAEIKTKCLVCETDQTLAEATVTERGEETIYTCKNGCEAIVTTEPLPGPDDEPRPGYPWGDWFVRNQANLAVPFFNPHDGSLLGTVMVEGLDV
jgi:hypothetical protein